MCCGPVPNCQQRDSFRIGELGFDTPQALMRGEIQRSGWPFLQVEPLFQANLQQVQGLVLLLPFAPWSLSCLAHITGVRLSDDGWATISLELKGDLHVVTEGDYKTNRWQFTTSSDKVEDLTLLARSLLTLKDHCENNAT